MSPPPIIRARGLTKRFGDFTAVDGLAFAVAPGSIFAFLGANGSGKSTTIRMLIGLLEPTAGAIEVDGIDVIRTPRRVRDHIGYMGQKVSLYQGLTLRENLEFYAGLYGIDGAALASRWGALRERFELAEAEHEHASELPAGVRQRAGLALSTLHRPRVLFLDEPTAGVDIENRLRFWDLIKEEAAAGVTVFVTTHFLEEVEYCDWVCFIDAGRLIANGDPETIRRTHSEGYAVELALPAARRAAAAAALAAPGARVRETADGVRLEVPTLDDTLMTAVGRVAGTDVAVRVHQPEMTEVFRRMMRESAAVRAEGGAEAPAEVVVAPEPTPEPEVAPPSRPHVSLRTRLAARRRRLRTLMQREVRATLRDPFTVIILITVPLAALLAFGYVLSIDVDELALGIHDASRTPASRRLVAALAANGTFTPKPYATRAALDRALVAGTVSVAVVIPSDFARAAAGDRDATGAGELQVLYDGAETILAGNAEAAVRGIVAATAAEIAAAPPGALPPGVAVVPRALFNPDLDGTPFMVAGTYGFVLTFLTTLITAVSIVNERVTGTFEQLQVTPATAAEIVLGKILPLGAVFALDVVIMLVLAGLLLGVWPAGSAVLFVAVSACYVLISLALGLILSATSPTAAAAVQKTVLLSIPLVFLAGFMFPIRNMPLPFRVFAELVPATHYIRITRAIYLRAEGVGSLLPEIAIVLAVGAVLMGLAFRTVGART